MPQKKSHLLFIVVDVLTQTTVASTEESSPPGNGTRWRSGDETAQWEAEIALSRVAGNVGVYLYAFITYCHNVFTYA